MIELLIGMFIGSLTGLVIASLNKVSAISELFLENEFLKLENKILKDKMNRNSIEQPVSPYGDVI